MPRYAITKAQALQYAKRENHGRSVQFINDSRTLVDGLEIYFLVYRVGVYKMDGIRVGPWIRMQTFVDGKPAYGGMEMSRG